MKLHLIGAYDLDTIGKDWSLCGLSISSDYMVLLTEMPLFHYEKRDTCKNCLRVMRSNN